MDISAFRTQIDGANGFARPNRFQVYFPTAALVQGSSTIFQKSQLDEFPATDATDWMGDYASGANDGYRLTAFCEKSELPAYQFQADTQRIYGPAFKVPHMPEWSDVTMSFFCGGDMEEKYFFEAWMFMVMDPASNNFNYRNEYGVDVDIVSFDENDQENYCITLVSTFPIAVNTMPLSYEDNNSISRVQVTFTYKYGRPFAGASGDNARRGKKEIFNNTIGVGQRENFVPGIVPPNAL